MLAAGALWWLGWLLASTRADAAWTARTASLPSMPVAHALVMSLSFMPFFFAGFLFTAGPRWLGLAPVPARRLLVPAAAMLAGWCIALPALHLQAQAAGAGLALVAAGWSAAWLRFVALVRASSVEDKRHARLAAAACGAGAATLWLAAAALAVQDEALLRATAQAALWCFAASMFVVVSHRMLPFFDAPSRDEAAHPAWLLWLPLAAAWAEGLGGFAALALQPSLHAAGAPAADAARAVDAIAMATALLQSALQAAAALALLSTALRWPFAHGLKTRMVTMLFGGFAWLGVAFAFAAAAHLCAALGAAPLGLAPRALALAGVHALALGYLGATLFAMATRVAAAHGGRSFVVSDGTTWALYWLVQAAAFARVGAALLPMLAPTLTPLAALAWAWAACGWALRCGDWFLRPRADGRAG